MSSPRTFEQVVDILRQLSADTDIALELLADDRELIQLAKHNAPYENLMDYAEVNY